VALLADDDFGRRREAAGGLPNASYLRAFDEIDRDPRNEFLVVEGEEGGVGRVSPVGSSLGDR
jgi:hypothetical protein